MSSPLLEIAQALDELADDRPSRPGCGPEGRAVVSERRAHARFRPIDLPRPMLARLKYGPLLKLVDVSEGGALVETAARLNPGAHVVLEIVAPGVRRAMTVPSRVTRAQISAVTEGLRYRGGLTFRHHVRFDDLTIEQSGPLVRREPARLDEPAIPAADASALADAIGSIRSVASGASDRRVVRLLDDIVRQVQVCTAPRALMAFVEERLRRHVPLVAVAVGPRPRVDTTSEALAFELGHAETDDLQRMHVEFRPACRLDDSQVRLLHAGASVMSLIYTWHRALPHAR